MRSTIRITTDARIASSDMQRLHSSGRMILSMQLLTI